MLKSLFGRFKSNPVTYSLWLTELPYLLGEPADPANGLINSNNVVAPVYAHLAKEEPVVFLQVDNDIYNDTGTDTARTVVAGTRESVDSSDSFTNVWADVYHRHPVAMPVRHDRIVDS